MSTASASHDLVLDNEPPTPKPSGVAELATISHPGPEVLADKYLDTASRAVPSIEVDDSTVPDGFQLPERKENGYYGDLWIAFYTAGKPGTEAKVLNEQFALLLARELYLYYAEEPSLFSITNAETVARDLRSWVDLGRLRRAFYLYIEKSRTDKNGGIYQAVKKCDEEAVEYGMIVLEHYESRMVGDKTITRLRTDLFLDLYLGDELDLLIDEQRKVAECGQPSSYRLDWWARIDDQFARLDLRSALQANPNPKRSVIADITGDIIDKLRSQGIVVKALTRKSQPLHQTKGKRRTTRRQEQQRMAASQTTSREKGEPGSKAVEELDKDGYASGGDTDEISDIENVAAAICTQNRAEKEAKMDK